MKKTNIALLLIAAGLLSVACNPIEDDDLRDKYVTNAGAPITPEELTAALVVEQPYENSDERIEGDQCVHIKNTRPEIAGTWHIGAQTMVTDDKIITLSANGTYDIYFVAVHNNAIVTSEKKSVTVTNVFDDWMKYLTGATDKIDMDASKTWGYRDGLDDGYCGAMTAYGYWKYYPPEKIRGQAWWGQMKYADLKDLKMEFGMRDRMMVTYNADGSVKERGEWSYNREVPDTKVLGEFNPTIKVIGSNNDQSGSKLPYWILDLTEDYFTIYHCTGKSTDWETDGWQACFEVRE